MPDELFDFRSQIDEGGYDWVRAPLGNKPTNSDLFLTSSRPIGVARPVVEYSPLRHHTGLFRHFAAIEPKRESIREFANTYGLLGGDVSQEIIIPGTGSIQISFQDRKTTKKQEPLTLGMGETLSSWTKEILAMRPALLLWDLVAAQTRKELSRYVHWRAPDVVEIRFPVGNREGFALIASPQHRPHLLQQIPAKDVFKPTLFYIQDTINKHLEGRISPRLLWEKDWPRLGLFFVPKSLIGALWLQFARAVDGNTKYGRCLECRTWFEVSLDAARTNRRYCKDACRFKAYRRRQTEAQRLFAKGIPVKQIAKRLDSKLAAVKSWIDQP